MNQEFRKEESLTRNDMIKNVWSCNTCKKRRTLENDNICPDDTVELILHDDYEIDRSYHFCNLICLEKFIIKEGTKEAFKD